MVITKKPSNVTMKNDVTELSSLIRVNRLARRAIERHDEEKQRGQDRA